MSKEIILQARGIKKIYPHGNKKLEVLKGVDFSIHKNDDVCIVGSSGAGKSTLLHILGTLDRPSSGTVLFENKDVFKMSDAQLAKFRNESIGFVFQFHYLMKDLTAIENVMMPGQIAGDSKAKCREKALTLLDQMGMSDRIQHYPSELSGGEQQRVAIARALMQNPDLLFCDEPTGNLDTKNSQMIQQIFFDLQKERGLTLVVVTHDRKFAQKFSKTLEIKDGQWIL